MSTDLYDRTIRWSEHNLDARGHQLTLVCWQDRPWMVNVYTGSTGDDRMSEIMEWCRHEFGDEAWPIHGRGGPWYRGGATVNGWTHFGFESEEMMDAFLEAWPAPEDADAA